MKKVFVRESNSKDYNQVMIFNENDQTVTFYKLNNKIGFKFGLESKYSVNDMGYESVKTMIKDHKKRGILGQEITLQELKDMERTGFVNLGVERIKRAGRVCTSDFKDVCDMLISYGLGFVDAQNTIIYTYLSLDKNN